MNLKEIWNRLFRVRSGLAIIILVALLIELTGAIQYYFTHAAISKEARSLAQKELEVIDATVKGHLYEVEMVVKCMALRVENHLNSPESINEVLKDMLKACPNIVNCAVTFIPNYYPEHGRWYEPLATRNDDGSIDIIQTGGPDHDYFELPLYKTTMECDSDYWSEPYWNVAGHQMMVASYSRVIKDEHGKTVGLLCADVPLDWLEQIANNKHIYPSSFIMMMSREGRLIVYPVDKSKVLNQRVQDIHDGRHKTADELNSRMMAGESGEMEVINLKGEKRLVYFAPVGSDVGWSIAVVYNKKEVYSDLRRLQVLILLLAIFGMALMGYIIWRTARNQLRMQEINAANERIGSELRVASNIQQGMLPKKYPPFPSRNDIDIYASLTPAKEVGGDLYDYLIRDEKLYFCIGDVSGKGVPASLVMAVVRSLFHTITAHESRPAQILDIMNRAGSHSNDQLMFVTFFIGILDLPTGRLRYCNAGHDAPLLIADGKPVQLDVVPNLPIGIDKTLKYTAQETTINPGTTLFLYTDGLTEAMDINHRQFTLKRVMDVLNNACEQNKTSATELLEQMSAAVSNFVQKAEPSDDLAMMAINYSKPTREPKIEKTISLANDIKEVQQLTEFITSVTDELNIDAGTASQVRLAVEEAVVNIMNYAYTQGDKESIDVRATGFTNQLVVRISDKGAAFDPTSYTSADITLRAEERPIGGLGIHLVRQYMDAINYERIDNQNILTLFKTI